MNIDKEKDNNSEFCSICENYYYWKVEDGVLKNICRNCGNSVVSTNPIVHENNYSNNQKIALEYVVNEYCKYDYTLPRTRKIMCPNCKDYTEIFYKKYNPNTEMALVYGCTVCNKTWIK